MNTSWWWLLARDEQQQRTLPPSRPTGRDWVLRWLTCHIHMRNKHYANVSLSRACAANACTQNDTELATWCGIVRG